MARNPESVLSLRLSDGRAFGEVGEIDEVRHLEIEGEEFLLVWEDKLWSAEYAGKKDVADMAWRLIDAIRRSSDTSVHWFTIAEGDAHYWAVHFPSMGENVLVESHAYGGLK